MIEVSMALFRELGADFHGNQTEGYQLHLYHPEAVALWPHRNKLRYFVLKKAVEAARHIRVMAVQQRILIFVGANNG